MLSSSPSGTAPKNATQPFAASLPQSVLLNGAGVPPTAGIGRNTTSTWLNIGTAGPNQEATECALRVVEPMNPTNRVWSIGPLMLSMSVNCSVGDFEPPVTEKWLVAGWNQT